MKSLAKLLTVAGLLTAASSVPAESLPLAAERTSDHQTRLMLGFETALAVIGGGGNQIYLPASVVANPLSVRADTADRSYVTVTLKNAADAPGQVVNLSYTNEQALVNPPHLLWVYGGDRTASFYLAPQHINVNTQIQVTASCGGGTAQTTILAAAPKPWSYD